MAPPLLFTSPIIRLAVDDESAPRFQTVNEGWMIREEYTPRKFRFQGEDYGAYTVVMERELKKGDDAGGVFIHGRFLAQDLDHMSMYATERPLRQRSIDEFFGPVFPPSGWTSNGESVLAADDWRLMTTPFSTGSLYRREPRLPLRSIVAALTAYQATDPITFTVASLHFEAFTTESARGPFLLLAQALEVIRNLMRGGPTGAGLVIPDSVTARLTRSLDWVFEISNTRSNTRHPATRRPAVSLHPEMGPSEQKDFLHDADLLARYVVSVRLGVPFVTR